MMRSHRLGRSPHRRSGRKTVIDEDTAGAAKLDLRKSAGVWVETRAKAAKLTYLGLFARFWAYGRN